MTRGWATGGLAEQASIWARFRGRGVAESVRASLTGGLTEQAKFRTRGWATGGLAERAQNF